VRDLAALTAADFEPLVGDEFRLSGTEPGAGQVDPDQVDSVVIQLVEVLRQREWPGHRQPFILHFSGPDVPVMSQSVYRLSHFVFGQLECFMGPVMSDTPGITYEAVFS
jgi:hypothetical protein